MITATTRVSSALVLLTGKPSVEDINTRRLDLNLQAAGALSAEFNPLEEVEVIISDPSRAVIPDRFQAFKCDRARQLRVPGPDSDQHR
jgi:hypothetical protein